jgi:hypothetical protein
MYNTNQIAELLGCTKQSVLNWVENGKIVPYKINSRGNARFSEYQYENMKANLPMPKGHDKRVEWLKKFGAPAEPQIVEDLAPIKKPVDRETIIPTSYKNIDKPFLYNPDVEPNPKIQDIVYKSAILLTESLTRPRTDIYNVTELANSTAEYFNFCSTHGVMPSFRRLANWYGYSLTRLNSLMKDSGNSVAGQYLDNIRDAIKDNLEQASLTNAVNNISAMFLLKSQYGYVETQKVVVEPSENLLGAPKTAEEIMQFVEADVVEE